MSLSGIWTAKGIDKLAAQTAGGPVLTIDKIALGDGGGIVPAVLPSQTALLKEVWRGLVNAVLVEPETPNAVTVEAVIPYSVGGFFIREWGIYDVDGDLIAVGPHAEFYKPLLAEGSGAELLERIQLPLANAGQVNLTISSEALATRKYVDQTATAKAREEVARHDADGEAHGGMAEELHNHVRDMNNPHQNPLPPLAQLKLPGLMCPDGCTSMVDAAGVLSALPGAQWRAVINYTQPVLVLGMDNKVYLWLAPSGPSVAGVGVKVPGAAGSEGVWLDFAASVTPPVQKVEKYDLGEFYAFRHPTLKPGFQPAHGGVIANAATAYPKAWAYLQTVEGQKLCTTEAQWQAMVNAVWHTNADGSRVGWNGIGGAPFYVLNTGNGTLRMPDLRGMYAEAAGFDALGVGGVHGDAVRNITGGVSTFYNEPSTYGALAITANPNQFGGTGSITSSSTLNASRVVPVAAKNQPRAWGSLACVCLDPSAS